MKRYLAMAGVCGLIAFSGPALGDAAQHLPMCSGCHGTDGIGAMADVPIIAGIQAEVQENALRAYRDGTRKCAPPDVMCQVMASLTEDDIAELSTHFAEMPYKPAGEDFDAALAAVGKKVHEASCGMCHGMSEPGDPGSSIVHGQRMAYLRFVMQQYASGERQQPPPMEAMVNSLTPEQIEAIVNYYASYRVGSE
jgi:sulfide dehydrogenase cytochrome subunit